MNQQFVEKLIPLSYWLMEQCFYKILVHVVPTPKSAPIPSRESSQFLSWQIHLLTHCFSKFYVLWTSWKFPSNTDSDSKGLRLSEVGHFLQASGDAAGLKIPFWSLNASANSSQCTLVTFGWWWTIKPVSRFVLFPKDDQISNASDCPWLSKIFKLCFEL